jgi:hypothetical protein
LRTSGVSTYYPALQEGDIPAAYMNEIFTLYTCAKHRCSGRALRYGVPPPGSESEDDLDVFADDAPPTPLLAPQFYVEFCGIRA